MVHAGLGFVLRRELVTCGIIAFRVAESGEKSKGEMAALGRVFDGIWERGINSAAKVPRFHC